MAARTDFWLYVHELTLSLENEGVTTDEQQTNVLDSLGSMPPMAREEILRELRFLVGELMAILGEISIRDRIRGM